MVKIILCFEIQHVHSLDDQKKLPPAVLVKIEITLASTDSIPRPLCIFECIFYYCYSPLDGAKRRLMPGQNCGCV